LQQSAAKVGWTSAAVCAVMAIQSDIVHWQQGAAKVAVKGGCIVQRGKVKIAAKCCLILDI
jgi:hypothetical protein